MVGGVETYETLIQPALERALGGRRGSSEQVAGGLEALARHPRLSSLATAGSTPTRLRSLTAAIGDLLQNGFSDDRARAFGAPALAHAIATEICLNGRNRADAAYQVGADGSRVSTTLSEFVEVLASWLAGERKAVSQLTDAGAAQELLVMSSEFLGYRSGDVLRYETRRVIEASEQFG